MGELGVRQGTDIFIIIFYLEGYTKQYLAEFLVSENVSRMIVHGQVLVENQILFEAYNEIGIIFQNNELIGLTRTVESFTK